MICAEKLTAKLPS